MSMAVGIHLLDNINLLGYVLVIKAKCRGENSSTVQRQQQQSGRGSTCNLKINIYTFGYRYTLYTLVYLHRPFWYTIKYPLCPNPQLSILIWVSCHK